MKIILDNGAYSLRNMGDVAMLQVAAKRLAASAQDSKLMVLTTDPERLRRYCPEAEPLSVTSRDCAYESNRKTLSRWKDMWARLKFRRNGVPDGARAFTDAFRNADALLVAGGGFINDINPYQSRPLLRMLADAGRRGMRTALFSQGLGPLTDPELLGLLGRACRAGARVGLRERLFGPEIMSRAGISTKRSSITGDDAVEMAYQNGISASGMALGFSIRQVAYSKIDAAHLDRLSEAVRKLRQKLTAEIVPLPISFNSHEMDHQVIEQITGSAVADEILEDPNALIRKAARCRLVLTGTYHAAVFALSQGIPCVCFYASRYYRNKLEGLAGQFPGGCEVVDLDRANAVEDLENVTARLWSARGDGLCATLRQAAHEQIKSSESFYRSVLGAGN